jgi:hypothetical protein
VNAIYSGCIPNPWLDVAKKLNEENQIKPVYWIGWSNYDNYIDIELELKNNFSECVFHDIGAAWKGIFPNDVNHCNPESLYGDLIDEIAGNELIAIKMMDRLDPNRKSFLFEERQRHFRMLLSKWLGIINELKIDVFISPSIPHRVFDYALYIACKIKNVQTLMFKLTPFRDLIIPIENLSHMPIAIYEDYNLIKSGSLDVDVPKEIVTVVNTLRKSYKDAEPDYMKLQKKTNISIFSLIIRKIFNIKSIIRILSKINKETDQYLKVSGKEMEKVYIKYYQSILYNLKGKQYKNELKRYYEKICTNIDINNDKYIFIALHYQPEETTCPSAGHYVNQNLIIENIAELLPLNIKIVIKEHSSQFHSEMEGHTSRYKIFYEDLIKIPNVVFISSDVPSFDFIDNALAVVTATGTIGWESIVRGKPVLIFGNAWYEYCDNVYRINSKSDLSKALNVILYNDNNQSDYYSYVKAIYRNSIQAYHYKGYDVKSKIDKPTCIRNLTQSIILNLR